MAQDSMMANLFGVSPEIYQQNQQDLARRQGIEFAQLDPYERVNAMAYTQGRQAGNVVGGLLGVQDPTMKLLSQRAELGRQFDLSTAQGYKSLAKELLAKNDPQGAQIALQKATDQELKESQINLREAQAKKANEYQMATTASERNRKLISEADVALKEGRQLSATQESALRYQVAQELKPKIFRDSTTGELTTIDPLNIGLAAPNVAKYLSIPQTTGTAGGVTTIQTPQSQEAQVSQAEALNELTNRTKDIRDVIGETKKLISGYTTGYGSFLSVLPLTDAKTLQNNLESIKANLSLSQLTALKEASKTGASGLGQVTRNEFDALQSTIAKLDPQSKTFANDLDKVDKTYARLLKQLEGKTERAEERVKATQPKKPEVPGMTPSDVAPNKSPFSGVNPQLQPEPTTPTKKVLKWSELK